MNTYITDSLKRIKTIFAFHLYLRTVYALLSNKKALALASAFLSDVCPTAVWKTNKVKTRIYISNV